MAHVVTVNMKQDKDYRFAIHFAEGIPVLYGDETPPLGNATGPTPAQLLAAAVGNCLSDSLLFAIRKFKQHPEPIQTTVAATIDRNAENRLRVQNISVTLTLGAAGSSLAHLDRALEQFEEFCTVGQPHRISAFAVGYRKGSVPILEKVGAPRQEMVGLDAEKIIVTGVAITGVPAGFMVHRVSSERGGDEFAIKRRPGFEIGRDSTVLSS